MPGNLARDVLGAEHAHTRQLRRGAPRSPDPRCAHRAGPGPLRLSVAASTPSVTLCACMLRPALCMGVCAKPLISPSRAARGPAQEPKAGMHHHSKSPPTTGNHLQQRQPARACPGMANHCFWMRCMCACSRSRQIARSVCPRRWDGIKRAGITGLNAARRRSCKST